MVLLVFIFTLNVSNVFALSVSSSQVYFPSGTKYNMSIYFQAHIVNETNQEVIFDQTIDVNLNFTLISKRINLEYVGWGAIIELPEDLSNFQFGGENITSIPIPPLIAVKEGTRNVYLPQIVFDLINNNTNLDQQGVQELFKRFLFLEINEDFYILNPFYINPNVKPNDEVEYGFRQISTGLEYIAKGTVDGETKISVANSNYDTVKVHLVMNELSQVGTVLGAIVNPGNTAPLDPELRNVLDNVTITVDLYYDTTLGWLLKTDLEINLDPQVFPENVTGQVSGNLNLRLIDAGNLAIGGKIFLANLIGVPSEAILAIDVALILTIIYLVYRRRAR